MGQLDLTVLVLNLSPEVTVTELNTFFSYCGTVEKIQLTSVNKDQQSALVTFRQPYAFRTALLLNDAILAGQPVRILCTQNTTISCTPDSINETEKHEVQEFLASVQAAMQTMALKGVEMLKKVKNELVENYKLSEKVKVPTDRRRSAASTAGGTAEQIGGAIKSNEFISGGALRLYGVLDKVSKGLSSLGNDKRDNPNSRKQK
ncbi:uncharacterized protein LOC8285717 [Ricinus communis]|uniref:uncharacterized protein LOC8285717 n=1 Tax=Ricinus communis TaxID=3988 RepID=UPI00201AC6A3|nr:uncharacterized protein LOC8285717 [Ricinus communis]XP_048225700.1 uncharacterized protein LOC8285717 [Ricinus communis]